MHAKKPQIAAAGSTVNAIAGITPFGHGFNRSRVRALGIVLAAALAVAGLALAEQSGRASMALHRRPDAALRQCRLRRHRAGVPERRDQHSGVSVHAQAPEARQAASQRHRPVVQYRVLVQQAAGRRAEQTLPIAQV
mgnify:CR=1 FL=1